MWFIWTGQSTKICNNMLLASTMIAVGESFELENLNLEKNYMMFYRHLVDPVGKNNTVIKAWSKKSFNKMRFFNFINV